MELKVVAFAGSLKKNSCNKFILNIIYNKIQVNNVDITMIDLARYDFPNFNQDVEDTSGMPPKVQEFKRAIHAANAIIIASPEYNGSFSGILKNAMDWASRKLDPSEGFTASFRGKPVGIVSASPGRLGGLRGLYHLRDLLINLGCIVMPEMLAIEEAQDINAEKEAKLEAFAMNFVHFGQKLI